jgi:O-methyltransferase
VNVRAKRWPLSLIPRPARIAARAALARAQGRHQPRGPIGLADLVPEDRAIVDLALPYTTTGIPRLAALVEAVRYCVQADVPGAFAECGVLRGGSVLAMILTLQAMQQDDRDIYLYDTFTGMTEPTELDVSRYDPPALSTWAATEKGRNARMWTNSFTREAASEAIVRATLTGTGYPQERLHFVAGKVEETLPAHPPSALALLRLDTDWYASTHHELVHLYPLLSEEGVLIVDDYGHWEGARRAVDEYFVHFPPRPLLVPIDYTARIGVKPSADRRIT